MEAVKERIVYEGEDKEKEEMQGRERNMRQRSVALFIKHSQVGL